MSESIHPMETRARKSEIISASSRSGSESEREESRARQTSSGSTPYHMMEPDQRTPRSKISSRKPANAENFKKASGSRRRLTRIAEDVSQDRRNAHVGDDSWKAHEHIEEPHYYLRKNTKEESVVIEDDKEQTCLSSLEQETPLKATRPSISKRTSAAYNDPHAAAKNRNYTIASISCAAIAAIGMLGLVCGSAGMTIPIVGSDVFGNRVATLFSTAIGLIVVTVGSILIVAGISGYFIFSRRKDKNS